MTTQKMVETLDNLRMVLTQIPDDVEKDVYLRMWGKPNQTESNQPNDASIWLSPQRGQPDVFAVAGSWGLPVEELEDFNTAHYKAVGFKIQGVVVCELMSPDEYAEKMDRSKNDHG